jgi:hypothetical protein
MQGHAVRKVASLSLSSWNRALDWLQEVDALRLNLSRDAETAAAASSGVQVSIWMVPGRIGSGESNRMQRNATEARDEPSKLSPIKQQALAALLAGSTVTAAADAEGVDRTTVHRWLRSDCDIQAAMNRARRELRDATASRLYDAAQRALSPGWGLGAEESRRRRGL